MYKMVLFQTGDVNFAVELGGIRHMGGKIVAPNVAQSRIPEQTIKYEGRSIKLIDLAAVLSQNVGTPYPSYGKIVIAKETPDKALWADKVKGLFTAKREQIYELPSVFTGAARGCFPKVVRFKEHLFLVVDPAALGKLTLGDGVPISARNTTERVA